MIDKTKLRKEKKKRLKRLNQWARKLIELRESERICGGCTLCCFSMGIGELQKPAYTTCQHSCKQGCLIYGQHPQECKDYRCLWLQGFLEDCERPDEVGWVIYARPCEAFGKDVIQANCSVYGFSQAVIDRVAVFAEAVQTVAMIMQPDGRRTIVGRRDLVLKFSEMLRTVGWAEGGMPPEETADEAAVRRRQCFVRETATSALAEGDLR